MVACRPSPFHSLTSLYMLIIIRISLVATISLGMGVSALPLLNMELASVDESGSPTEEHFGNVARSKTTLHSGVSHNRAEAHSGEEDPATDELDAIDLHRDETQSLHIHHRKGSEEKFPSGDAEGVKQEGIFKDSEADHATTAVPMREKEFFEERETRLPEPGAMEAGVLEEASPTASVLLFHSQEKVYEGVTPEPLSIVGVVEGHPAEEMDTKEGESSIRPSPISLEDKAYPAYQGELPISDTEVHPPLEPAISTDMLDHENNGVHGESSAPQLPSNDSITSNARGEKDKHVGESDQRNATDQLPTSEPVARKDAETLDLITEKASPTTSAPPMDISLWQKIVFGIRCSRRDCRDALSPTEEPRPRPLRGKWSVTRKVRDVISLSESESLRSAEICGCLVV